MSTIKIQLAPRLPGPMELTSGMTAPAVMEQLKLDRYVVGTSEDGHERIVSLDAVLWVQVEK